MLKVVPDVNLSDIILDYEEVAPTSNNRRGFIDCWTSSKPNGKSKDVNRAGTQYANARKRTRAG